MGAPNPDVVGLVNLLALRHWLPSNTPNLSSVVNAVTAQLTELGGVITQPVIDFATIQVDQFYAAQVQVTPGGTLGVTSLDTPSSGQTLAIGPTNAGKITLGTSGATRVTVDSTGHVAILAATLPAMQFVVGAAALGGGDVGIGAVGNGAFFDLNGNANQGLAWANHYFGNAADRAAENGFSPRLALNSSNGTILIDTTTNVTADSPIVRTNVFTLGPATTAVMKGTVADGATAVAAALDNVTALATVGAKILSLREATVERGFVDRNGGYTSIAGQVSGAQLTASPTNGGTVATDASAGNSMTVIAGAGVASFTLAAPTNPTTGQFFTWIFENASGGALTTNFNAVFKTAGAWTSAATGNERGVTFLYDGTSWREVSRNAADVPL